MCSCRHYVAQITKGLTGEKQDMKVSGSHREPRHGKRTNGGWTQGANVTDLIRTAEKHIASRKYSFALEQLMAAQQIEPRNSYIQAIIYRIQNLQKGGSMESGALEVTVGSEFLNGIKGPEDESSIIPQGVQARVRQLTNLANNYLEKGSFDFAFESLMKAYLLDPTSPYVLACEKVVLPVWENARTNKQQLDSDGGFVSLTMNTERTTMAATKNDGSGPNNATGVPGSGQSGLTMSQDQRLEMLKQQKELERRERERALWQEASKPPRIFGEEDFQGTAGDTTPETPKHVSGLFSKLKLGKFLG
ncbi:MAG: hypothetical protein HW407_1171 [Bacteroidetes bacterium]|nr:hypothetical protein [Bacteroidota bacterium]